MDYNLYIFVKEYDSGTVARNILDQFGAENMQWKADKLFKTPDGRSVITGFWWRAYVPADKLELCKKTLDDAGTPWFRQ